MDGEMERVLPDDADDGAERRWIDDTLNRLSRNDGRQTPWRGHPVFTAQHATATCCRGCIAKWHHLPQGRELTDAEIDRLADLVMAWIERDLIRHPAV